MVFIAVAFITAINLAIVAAASVLAIHGDGTPGEMPLVLVLGGLWVMAFAARSVALARAGEVRAALGVAAKAIPLGLLAVMLATLVYSFLAAVV